MSESVSPAAAVEGPTNVEHSELQALGQELAKEGHMQDGFLSDDQAEPAESDSVDAPDEEEDDGVEKIKLKVNGKTIEKTLPEMISLAQQYEATQLKLETAKKEITEARAQQKEVAAQQAAVKELITVMKNGDLNTIMDFVTDKLDAAQNWNRAIVDYAIKLVEESRQSPAEREAAQNKKLIEKYQRESEQRKQEEARRNQEYAINQASEQIAIEVPKALTLVGLPDTAWMRDQVISTWRAALERGQNPTCAAVAAYVKKRLDESKISVAQPEKPKPAPQRPRATPESVARRPNGRVQDDQYVSWESWKNTRGF